ncbi:MAG: hypothetical protein J6O17_07260 [Eubacterium sp.]|nr:hypothetical protein [Eubacterium sp.]
MGVYNIMFVGGLVLAILFFILTLILFFALRIPQAFGSVTGQTEKKALEQIRAGKTGDMTRRKRKSQGRIVARDVKTSTSTGTLVSGNTDIQRSGSGKVTKDTGRIKKGTGSIKKDTGNIKKDTDMIAQEAKEAAAKAAAEMAAKEEAAKAQAAAEAVEAKETKTDKNDKTVRINPKTGKRYELDAEDTEILTYGDLHDAESPTTFLGAKMPGENEETDILREGVNDDDLYDDDLLTDEEASTAILAAGMAMDLDREETDLLTSQSVVIDGEEPVYNDNDEEISEADTDVLMADGTSIPKPTEPGEKKKPPKSITDMLRKAMEEGKDIPDLDVDDDDDEDEEYTYSESEEMTSALKAEAAAQEALTQEDVNGILDENLTSVLRAGMMPGAEEEAPTEDSRIDVLYTKTIVHTEETL